MGWQRLGKVFDPATQAPWVTSHAQVPTVLVLQDRLRIYYAGRDEIGKSYPTYFDLDREDPTHVIYVHDRPVLERGQTGAFDDAGIMPSATLLHDGQVWMYYTGWNQRVTTPYHNTIGLAVSDDGGTTFKRKFEGPVLDRTAVEPFIAVTPSVIRDQTGWAMWYSSGTDWVNRHGKMESVYVVKSATSSDGVNWTRPNRTCVESKFENEAFSSPHVVKRQNVYRMWYCSRAIDDYHGGKGSYRVGSAVSKDAGQNWQRCDEEFGIHPYGQGWESEMTCYPCPVELNGRLFVFYNGNGFGRSGIGLAVWDEKPQLFGGV